MPDGKQESRREVAERIARSQIAEVRKGSQTSDMSLIEPERIIHIPSLIDAIEAALKSEAERCAELAEECHPQPCTCQTCLIHAEAGAAIRRTIRNGDTNA